MGASLGLRSCWVGFLCLSALACESPAENVPCLPIYTDFSAREVQVASDLELTARVNEFSASGPGRLLATYHEEWRDRLTINNLRVAAVEVGPTQLPDLAALVAGIANVVGVDPPDTFVVQDPIPNAYVTNVERPVLVLHSRLIELLSQQELAFVIGHELPSVMY